MTGVDRAGEASSGSEGRRPEESFLSTARELAAFVRSERLWVADALLTELLAILYARTGSGVLAHKKTNEGPDQS